MPPQQTNLTSEPGRDAAGLDLAITSVEVASNGALAAAPLKATIAALDDALSEKDAAGPPATSTRSVSRLLNRCWRAFQEWRQRERVRATLYDLSERELMDIGVTPGEIEYIAARQAIDRLRADPTCLSILSRGVM